MADPAEAAQLASRAATDPGAIAVFGCFAPDGSQHCSGLPVARYSPAQLARQVGAKWLLISQDREEHITPGWRHPGRCAGSGGGQCEGTSFGSTAGPGRKG